MKATRFTPVLLCLLLLLSAGASLADTVQFQSVTPSLPQPMLGSFVGVSGGDLISAGGATHILNVLDSGTWHQFHLDAPIGWGAAVTVDDSLICLGGETARQISPAVIRLRWQDGRLLHDRL